MTPAWIFSDPGFIIPFTLLQVLALLLVIWALDAYEREPMAAVAAVALWGATIAPAIVIAVREPVLQALPSGERAREAMMAALVEEPAKGIALVVAFALSTWGARRFGVVEFEGVTDGAVYGAAIGLGFAFTENLFYLVQQDTVASGLTVLVSRSDFGGLSMLGHAVYTGAFGAGLGLATWQRGWVERVGFAAIGLAAAVIMHAVHNGLYAGGRETAGRAVDYAFVVAFALVVAAWLARQRRIVSRILGEECSWGLIAEQQCAQACRPWRTLVRHIRLSLGGETDQVRVEREMNRELVELAFARWRLRNVGFLGASEPLASRRRRITQLQVSLALAQESDARVGRLRAAPHHSSSV